MLYNGTIPSEIGYLTNLREFKIGDGLFIGGTIPSEIGLMQGLEGFSLAYTYRGRGELPSELGKLTNLRDFSIGKATDSHKTIFMNRLRSSSICCFPSKRNVVTRGHCRLRLAC